MYQRVILKLSGEALKGNGTYGIHPTTVKGIATEIKELYKLGVEVGIVVGAGNLWRGKTAEELGITDPAAVARFNEKVGDRTKSEERLRKKEIAADAAARSRIFFNTLRLSQKDSFLNNHKSIKKRLGFNFNKTHKNC